MVNILNQHHKECTDRILLLYTSLQFLFRISMFPLCHKSFMKFLPWYTGREGLIRTPLIRSST